MGQSPPRLSVHTHERATDVVAARTIRHDVANPARADGIELRERRVGLAGRFVEHSELPR